MKGAALIHRKVNRCSEDEMTSEEGKKGGVMKRLAFSSMTVHQSSGSEFAARLMEPESFRMLGELSEDASSYNMRTLATAIRMLNSRRECLRLLVPVEMNTLDACGGEYIGMLMSIPENYRYKMFLELTTNGEAITDSTAAFSYNIQHNCGMSLAVWASCGDLGYVRELMNSLSPAILGIDKRCIKNACRTRDRSFVLDAAELAVEGGARVLAEGIDTAHQRDSMREIGIDLLCGSAMSDLREEPEGEYRRDVRTMEALCVRSQGDVREDSL